MSDEIKFVNGLSISAPHEKAPDFVKAKGWIQKEKFIDYLRSIEGDSLNFDVKVSKNGKWYCQVNDWKPDGAKKAPDEYRANNTVPSTGFTPPPAPEDDLPF